MTSVASRKQQQEYVVPSSNSQDIQPSPLALLAATCSKIGSPTDEGGSPVKVLGPNQVIQSGEIIATATGAHLVPFQPQTVGVLNPDGTVTQVGQQPTATANVHVSGNVAAPKIIPAQNFSQVVAGGPGNITYNVIPAQQLQNIQIDGQEIYIPTMPQTFQIQGNQIIQSPNGQTFLRAQGVPTSVQNGSQAVLQGMAGATVAQIGGQNVTIRQGNVVQALQLPMPIQQTIPIQVPISTNGGHTVLQTIHVPVQNLQGVPGANVLQPQGQPITLNVPAHMLSQLASQMGPLAQEAENETTDVYSSMIPNDSTDSNSSSSEIKEINKDEYVVINGAIRRRRPSDDIDTSDDSVSVKTQEIIEKDLGYMLDDYIKLLTKQKILL